MAAYKRIIFKLSGEALKSGSDLFDFAKVQEIAEIIRENLEEPEYGEPKEVVVHYGLIDEQNNIFSKYCDVINLFDNTIRFQLTFENQNRSKAKLVKTVQIPEQDDDFNSIRKYKNLSCIKLFFRIFNALFTICYH